ncbi:GAF domain-containing sensor histidine kinase [Dictyobacter formicarum]|uniref:histidine kinase n=1 Tax=Dictyobacter formicarum TaxID=2778368 RepID=A0ABQ3VJB2_9CHLR|nr:GAF domain-containing sensor histidine kinase [Dictyobacter formicarum]GHO86252.1 hypothetical protein KSZ_42580 [Dictyobacter formicarum]
MAPTATDNSDWEVDASRRSAAFARTSMALMRETDEGRLLEHITNTCCAATTAELAACSLCAVDTDGKPIDVADEGLFHIACAVGVTDEQRVFAQSVPLAGIGLLRPIFKYGSPVRINDILSPDVTAYHSFLKDHEADGSIFSPHVRDSVFAEPLHATPLPSEHPPLRSFLGAPFLNYDGEVIGALLLGHSKPGHFSAYDELLAAGLATVAAVALENIRSCQRAQLRDRDLEARQELGAQRATLQMIIDEMPGSVYLVHGPDARLVFINRAASALWQGQWELNQPMGEFLQQSQITIFDENGVPIPFEQLAIMRAINQRKATHQQLEELRYADGRYVPMNVSTSLISIPRWLWPTIRSVFSLQDKGPLVVVVHQDMAALIDAECLIDEFIDTAAHELLSPLAILRGFSQSLMLQSKRGCGAALTDWQLEAIEGIEQATTRMAAITTDLLDATRLQAGCLNVQLEPHDLVALVRRVVQRLQLTTSRHQLNVHTGLDHLIVEIDVDRMEQVLTNLIQSAIKYCPEGGPIDLDISEGHESQHVCIAVVSIQIYGISIPTEQQAKIFECFNRTDNAHAFDGAGLGLYLCRALIELHQGQIWFESLESECSAFYITLPAYFEDKPMTCPLT